MTFNLPSLDHSMVKQYCRSLSDGILTISDLNQELELGPEHNLHMVTFAIQLSRLLDITEAEFIQFLDHSTLFAGKVQDLPEHPYSFTEAEHSIFCNSLGIIRALVNQNPHALLELVVKPDEGKEAMRFAKHILERTS